MDWKKNEKEFYLPKNEPIFVKVPAFKFFTISGSGNPNKPEFVNYIQALYSLSYGVRMSYKTDYAPKNYEKYTVYPLEGVWDISEKAKASSAGKGGNLDKDELVFTLMIRQPDFVDTEFVEKIIEITKNKKPNVLLDQVKFETIEEGRCIQMLHFGSYDEEPGSFKLMEEFAIQNAMKRKSLIHREIYLSDFRKVAKEKLRTVLRFQVD
jgi:hypothetical protein